VGRNQDAPGGKGTLNAVMTLEGLTNVGVDYSLGGDNGREKRALGKN